MATVGILDFDAYYAVNEEGYTNLKWNETKELWNITSVPTYLNTYYMESTHVPDTYIEWYIRRLCFKTYYDIENENGEFDMQFFVDEYVS